MVTCERFIHRLNNEGTITVGSHSGHGVCDFTVYTTLYLSFETREGLLKPYWEVIKDSVAYRVKENSKRQPGHLVVLGIISRAHIQPLNEGACISGYFSSCVADIVCVRIQTGERWNSYQEL